MKNRQILLRVLSYARPHLAYLLLALALALVSVGFSLYGARANRSGRRSHRWRRHGGLYLPDSHIDQAGHFRRASAPWPNGSWAFAPTA